jgi:hypothetical protein
VAATGSSRAYDSEMKSDPLPNVALRALRELFHAAGEFLHLPTKAVETTERTA